MSQDAINQMKADKNLEADINKATTPDEIRALLHAAIERSPELGITRDENTGRFVARESVAPDAAAVAAAAKAAADAAPREFKQTVTIGGQAFDFVGSSAENLQSQIDSAKSVATALAADNSPARFAQSAAERAMTLSDAEIAFKTGQMTTAEYLRVTGAVEEYLASQGVDIQKVSTEQFEKSWSAASTIFRNSPAGENWPGGMKNQELIGMEITAMGAIDAVDKVAALTAAYERLKAKNMLFDGDFSQKQIEAMTANATPAEILAAWKEGQNVAGGDTTTANENFISIFREGRSSGLFDR
jgi:hypothetical protein